MSNGDTRSLSILVHGHSKSGKSTFADTSPGPRLILDAEGGSRFTPSKKTLWNPNSDPPPEDDGSWSSCLVYVHKYEQVEMAYQWLASGKHPFRSVVIDSISEVQQRCVDSLAGTNPMKQQDWGTLLRKVSALVRQFRDLTTHQTKPLEAVVLIAMTREKDNGKAMPHVQGQLGTALPYYLDITGYTNTVKDDDGGVHYWLATRPDDNYEAGERVAGRVEPYIENPNIEQMLSAIYDQEESTP